MSAKVKQFDYTDIPTLIQIKDKKLDKLARLYNTNQFTHKSPIHSRILTSTLLSYYFDLYLLLPLHKLIPPIPNRIDYLQWIASLFKSTDNLKGIDIGCGATCIYPLIASRIFPNSSFLALESDKSSFLYALQNIKRNGVKSINIVHNTDSNTLLPKHLFNDGKHDFQMCNPPFYGNAQEKRDSELGKQASASGVNLGSANELFYDGGDLAWARKLYKESLELKSRIRWFTTLIGKKSTFITFHEELKMNREELRIETGSITRGNTVRWLIGWSFKQT